MSARITRLLRAHRHGGRYSLTERICLSAGEPVGRTPACVHPALTLAANTVCDLLEDGELADLLACQDPLMACPPRPDLEPVLTVRLAARAARLVLPAVPQRAIETCTAAIRAAEQWCTDRSAAAAKAAEAAASDAAAFTSEIFTDDAGDYGPSGIYAACGTASAVQHASSDFPDARDSVRSCADRAIRDAAQAAHHARQRGLSPLQYLTALISAYRELAPPAAGSGLRTAVAVLSAPRPLLASWPVTW
jgi:hypothetical protein